MGADDDQKVFDRAAREARVLISADTDFATLLALRKAAKPSLIVFRRSSGRHPQAQVGILLSNLAELSPELQIGCIAVLEDGRIRLRRLPL
jgi:predicted nuclease of predicted toxin-antitoxin system